MAILEVGPVARGGPRTARRERTAQTRSGARLDIPRLLRLWHARHRDRQELAMRSARDCRDAGIARDLAAYEARRWPWQKWNPQWREFDEMLLGMTGPRRRSPTW